MKNLIKRALTPNQRRLLRRILTTATRFASGILVRALCSLPLGLAVATKEGAVLIGRLDYDPSDLWLHLDSEVELTLRLNACQKEPETVRWIHEHIRSGDVLWDVGANVGAYSLVAARASGGRARVYAFEPSPVNFHKLHRNILTNGQEAAIIPIPISLSDVTGVEMWNFRNLIAGGAGHSLGVAQDAKLNAFQPMATQPVLTCRADDLVRIWQIEKPHHIKLDTDGSELRILRGARDLLDEPGLRSLLIEIEPACETAHKIEELLHFHGFRVISAHSHGASRHDTSNYIFMRVA